MKKYSLFFFYLLAIVFLESSLRLQFKGTILTEGLLLSLLFGLIFASILFVISTIFKSNINRRISLLLTAVLSLLFASQLIYYRIFRTFYIVYSAGNAGDVMEFASIALSAVLDNLVWVLIMFVPLVILVLLEKKNLLDFQASNFSKLALIFLGILFHVAGLIVLNSGDREINSPYNLYHNIHQPEFSIENLGLLTYTRLDVKRQVFGYDPKDMPDNDMIQEYVEFTVDNGQETSPKTRVEANMFNIDFQKLLEAEDDKKTSHLHKYFSLMEPSSKNDYTGRFEGYNLIFITAESFSHLAVREDITPTLYKMVHDGFNFTNFYTPIWGVSTTDGEYVATTGLLPKAGTWSYSKSKDNHMPFSMGNQLGNKGYETKAYHNHTYDYYDRQLTHENMGYDYKGLGNGLDVDRTWPESDIQLMELTIPEYIESDRFHTYYMTVSGHFRYEFGQNYIADKNKSLVEDLPYSDSVKAYLATQIELDRALEYLLEELDKAGLSENTLIALSSDHYPYGLSLEQLSELSGKPVDTSFEIYRNSFILYADGMEAVTVKRPLSSLDIIPTLSNLLGLDFDSRLLMGNDAFADKPPLVIFSNRSFITDKGRFNAETGEFIPSEEFSHWNSEEIENYRSSVSEQIHAKFLYSAWMLETDYYSKVLREN